MKPFRSAVQIRREFLDFFIEKHGHRFVPSAPVVPRDDPTLLFANAGMNQFKDVFLGTGRRPYSRAVNSQKCIRAGGKHNDLDDVGRDSYHHTFFEMLGNWSFGDYFKPEAIQWAWSLLTDLWGMDKKRLYVTVFGGDESDGLPADSEAEELWKGMTDIDPTHISRWGKKDNFWEMGDTGPCGPCTEIHYDLTPDHTGGALVNQGTEKVIEFWNLVFIQFDRGADGQLTPLPARHVDTGMGFERICRILQGRKSNYDIDLWFPIFLEIEQRSGAKPYGGSLESPVDTAYRVIADHIRTLTFAINDGAVPGNDGRGYVLRRILRRAVRFARQTLGVRGAFLYHLVPAVVQAMSEAFPELTRNPQHIANVIMGEEESFGRTLDRGLELFAEAADRANESGKKQITAADAFRLHDTYGFPIDLTEQMALEKKLTIDLTGYERLMEEARQKARAGGLTGGGRPQGVEMLTLTGDALARIHRMGFEATDDVDKFHGRPISARVKAIWNGRDFDARTGTMAAGEQIGLILNRTNFYAEMGGQVADMGMIRTTKGAEFEVFDTQNFGGYILHVGRMVRGRIEINETVQLEVDQRRRKPVASNHTGTHLLNLALRETLGDHVDQKGSLVAPDRLRFDFSHHTSMTEAQISTVSTRVNGVIDQGLEVYAEIAALDEARTISGLRAVFGERYPDPVRVVSIGKPVNELLREPGKGDWKTFSIEFCGGTHVTSTDEIAAFEIVSEEAVAKGVRRVTALTSGSAVEARTVAMEIREQIKDLKHADGHDFRLMEELARLVERVNDATLPLTARLEFRREIEQWQQRVKELRKAQGKASQAAVIDQARQIAESKAYANQNFIVAQVADANPESLRAAADTIRSKQPDKAFLLVSPDEEEMKVAIVASVPKALIDCGLKAGDWVREAAKACGGSGGGKPDMAMAGGKDPSKVGEALAAARGFADAKVGGKLDEMT